MTGGGWYGWIDYGAILGFFLRVTQGRGPGVNSLALGFSTDPTSLGLPLIELFSQWIARMKIPPGFTAIIDTREKLPYPLILADGLQLPHEISTLKTGDYSIKGFEDCVAFERKSLSDLLGCIGKHRERFERELSRLESKLYRGIVVEGSWRLIESCHLVSQLHPNAAVGSILSWVSRGIPVLMLENRERANEYVCRLLLHAYKRLSATGVDDDQNSHVSDPLVPAS